MKNNTKLIMETWRRFLKEDILDDEPPEGYYHEKYNDEGSNLDDDEGLDNPIDGEPPFDHAEPPEKDGIMADDDYDEVFEPPENDYDEIPYTQGDTVVDDYDKVFDERYYNDPEYDSEDYRPEDSEDSEF